VQNVDYTILLIYLAGIFLLGILLSGKNKSSSDMFSVSGESPWWTSGLSAFMTMFSAGTFVVWGGIAYKYGLVAVTINLCYGIAAVAVGYTIAGRWKKLGVNTPAEFIQLRFGAGAVKFYTWSMMAVNIIGAGVALYALSQILVALMPIPDGGIFADDTGHFSVQWAILIAGTIIIIYTMMGGLWAVLMTDVLQFIILNLAVLFVIPLIWSQAGGFEGFTGNAPEGFFKITQENKFTWFFMLGWVLIHFFKIGAEWAFAQRFICVPTEKDARKSTYLFGVLYLISPLFWLLPPMIYRTINPNAEPEQAYILACQAVLPLGMLGLMVAAMFSATASMVSSQLNVFAGGLTELFHSHHEDRSETQMLRIGRYYTIALGVFLTGIALAVPYLGGAEQVILSVTKLMVGPLLAPTIWGLVSKRVTVKAVWLTALICFVTGVILKLILKLEGTIVDISIGVILPVVILSVMHYLSKNTSSGWQRVQDHQSDVQLTRKEVSKASSLPALIVSICITLCAIIMFALIPFNPAESTGLLCIFGGLLLLISIVIFIFYKRTSKP
jgi:SSS family solute:Na+ symporter